MGSSTQPGALLLSMPWTALSEPSLGLGILKSVLNRKHIPCRICHLNLFLLEYLTARTYFYIGETFALNDFMFTKPLEYKVSFQQKARLKQLIDELLPSANQPFAGYTDKRHLLKVLLEIRNKAVPRFLQDCLQKVAQTNATMIGFTCMFDQTIASVALAKLIKQRFPDKLIVLGGYALEGPVGPQIIKSFPWVDVVAIGDGEEIIEPLARASIDRSILARVPGIWYRENNGSTPTRSSMPLQRVELNHSPAPDYDDYVTDLETLKMENKVTLQFDTLPVESSRGCWWGQNRHCIFCGIDDNTMCYRAKDPDIVFDMLAQMSQRYGMRQFRFSDYILPHDYFQNLLPRLVALDEPYSLNSEVKANLNYKRFRLLHDSGFVEIQPGIESFSSSVLKKVDKGVSTIQNIYTLILGLRFGIEVHYNFLFGFPTDEPDEYDAMLQVIPLLYHLTPPISRNNVVTVRFSPMYSNPARFGISKPIHHDPRYDLIFSTKYVENTGFNYDDYCYYFEQPYENPIELQQLYTLLRMQIQYWKDIHRLREVQLSYRVANTGIQFADSRYSESPKQYTFSSDHASIYQAICSEIRSERSLLTEFSSHLSPARIDDILDELIGARLVYREGNQYLGLAVPDSLYSDGQIAAQSAKWVSPFV